MDEVRLGEGDVIHEFVSVRLVVPQLCDSPVVRDDRQDNTLVDLGVQPLRVEVVRFAEEVIVHFAHEGWCCHGPQQRNRRTARRSQSMNMPPHHRQC